MADDRLSNDEFLKRLANLFNDRRSSNHGSVFITQKRLTPPGLPDLTSPGSLPSSSPFPDLNPPQPLPILFRATDGNDEKAKKTKLSTIVQSEDLEEFFGKYAECWKAGMSGLKKRDRSGRKAKAREKKKKGKEADVKKES